jgi:hypothetical protein
VQTRGSAADRPGGALDGPDGMAGPLDGAAGRSIGGRDGRGAMSFADALRIAIRDSGLTLDRLQHHLRRRGLPVSVAALSYWQRGRSRPERAGSIAAVRALEEILALPAGALVDRLAPRPPRGRGTTPGHGRAGVAAARPWPETGAAANVLSEVDRSCDHRLARLSLHDVYRLDGGRRPAALRVRQVLQSLDDGVDRIAGGYRMETGAETAPDITHTRYCRPGRIRKSGGSIAFELFFDRVLVRGETTIVEYDLEFSGERLESNFYDRRFRYPVRDYVAVVEFSADAVPVRCHRYERESLEQVPARLGELWVGTSRSIHLTAHDVTCGIIGAVWEWS